MEVSGTSRLSSSFRDSSGFVFVHGRQIHRQVNLSYRENYDHLMSSGLYQELAGRLLISHQEVSDPPPPDGEQAYKVLRPEQVPFLSYPYEWCFSQLKDAALTTLKIQSRALHFDMTLKDASAYNIQFLKGKPILIDTLSFEKYREGQPWVAYRQFCQHFLAPLLLMAYRDVRLNQLLRIHLDGVPLDLARTLLPFRALIRPSVLAHIQLHSRGQQHFAAKGGAAKGARVSRRGMAGLLGNLEALVKGLTWGGQKTEWGGYYSDTNYTAQALQEKKSLVRQFVSRSLEGMVWDLGANRGLFSRIASQQAGVTISFDMDPEAVENNYVEVVTRKETGLLPLLVDLTSPSPAIGWHNRERQSLLERGPAQTVLALALIHHLAISNNLPLARLADFFGAICHTLIIEFIPKEDSQVQRLLSSRNDVFPDYTREAFEKQFSVLFAIRERAAISDSGRVLYRMTRRAAAG